MVQVRQWLELGAADGSRCCGLVSAESDYPARPVGQLSGVAKAAVLRGPHEHEALAGLGWVGDRAAVARAALEVKGAGALLLHQVRLELSVGLRDHVSILVLADREQPVEVLDVGHAEPDFGR